MFQTLQRKAEQQQNSNSVADNMHMKNPNENGIKMNPGEKVEQMTIPADSIMPKMHPGPEIKKMNPGPEIKKMSVGNANGMIQKKNDEKESRYALSISKFPWTGVIDTKGLSDVGFHKKPEPSDSKDDNIWPSLLNGDIVKVTDKTANNWLHITIKRGTKTISGYVDWRYVNLSHEANVPITETVTDAPAKYAKAWNRTFQWNSRFNLIFDSDSLIVSVRIFSTATEAVKEKWTKSIEDKWSKKFSLEAEMDSKKFNFNIIINVIWTDDKSESHQVVYPGKSTTNMENWGTSDAIDITHEFGHMLGNKEEYFTVNGVKHGASRQKGKAVMNNPAENPLPRHFNLVKSEAAKALGIHQDKCKIK